MHLTERLLDFLLRIFILLEKRILFIWLVAVFLFSFLLKLGLSWVLISPTTLGPLTKIPHIISSPQALQISTKFPYITAQSVLVADLNTTRILYEKNSNESLAPASTTKLMTALVSLDLYNLQDSLKIPGKCLKTEGRKLGLSSDEIFLVEDLLHALLITSSNEAACILANSITTEDDFVSLMNEKAKTFNMSGTFFTNPIGFDSFDYSHKSTARDLYILALQARSNQIIAKICSKANYTLTSGKYPRTIQSTNLLLTQLKGSVGLKTGTTTQAGEVFIYEYLDSSKSLLIILMGSAARFHETETILTWLNSSYVWY